MRCLAFPDCRSLVMPTQPCPSCVAPVLELDAGAVVSAKAGERLSVPLILRNASSVRPLWVKRIAKRDGGVEEKLSIPWEQLDAGVERRFSLDTAPLVDGGSYTLNVLLVVATRHKSVEEEYAFAAGIAVRATVSSKGPRTVKYAVNAKSEGLGSGHIIRLPHPGLMSVNPEPEAAPGLANRERVPLERAERYELEQGIRGYQKEGLRVLRHVEFSFSGFRSDDTPSRTSALVHHGRLLFGRNARKPGPAANVAPNDVCLRAFNPGTTQVDEPATLAISRHHFEFSVVNDRLCVQARAASGMQVNDKNLTSGQLVPLAPGDRIIPIPGRPDKMTLRVAFTNVVGLVERIDVSRTPALSRNA
jgi:hypothetical protein